MIIVLQIIKYVNIVLPIIFIFLVNGIDESSNDSLVWVDRSTSPSPTPNENNHLG